MRRLDLARAGALLLGVMLPAVARACATCSGANDRNRAAFFWTTVLLSLLPLGMIAGGLLWWMRDGRRWLEREFVDRDAWTPPADEAAAPARPRRPASAERPPAPEKGRAPGGRPPGAPSGSGGWI